MEKGFTLIEVLVVVSLCGIVLAGLWTINSELFIFFQEEEQISELVTDLNWARNKSINEAQEYGIAFADDKYYLMNNRKEGEIITEKHFKDKVEIKEITLPKYQHDKISEISNAVFFQQLGNLAGHNGRIVLEFSAGEQKELVYSSNAGELNIREPKENVK